MRRKRFAPATILLLALLIAISSFFIYYLSNTSLNYTGYVSHIGSAPAILVGHFGQDGQTPNEYTYIIILNKGSTAQNVTVKFWQKTGTLRASTSNIVNPDVQWQLGTGSSSSGGPAATRVWDGYFTIEAPDVSKLLTQAYVILPNAGNFPGFPVTITLWQPSGTTAPSTPTPASTTPSNPTLPDTTLTATPRDGSISTSSSFSFTSNIAGITFECKLDSGSFESCTSPKRYTGLSRITHTFSVRARDTAGNVDPTPATFTWRII